MARPLLSVPAGDGAAGSGPSWTGKSITSLSLHQRATLWARLDTTPFVLLYMALGAVVLRWRLSQFTATFVAVVAVVLHILTLLAQHWSVAAHAFIAWRRVELPRSARERGVALAGLHALVRPRPHRGKAELVPLEVAAGERGEPVVRFHFQKRAYEYDASSGVWVKATYPVRRPVDEYRRVGAKGLTSAAVEAALSRYGDNRLDMPAPTFLELYKQHLLAPFFVFQVASVGLWMLDEYWYYALMTLSMMLIFEGTVVFGRLRSLRELRGMRNPPRDVLVLRNSRWTSTSSANLAPGDVVSLCRGASENELVPCDVLLLGGAAVVNEAMLTGESVPLMKEALAPQSAAAAAAPLAIKADDKAHVLFGGTRILTHTPAAEATTGGATAASSLRPPDRGTVCYVLRTGFGSAQGRLMRTILFSTDQVSADSREAAFLLLFLLAFAIAASGYVLWVGLANADHPRFELLLHCVLIVTNVVPPELPMRLALAVNTSLIALARAAIFCTEPFRIPYAGKIDICCFDKTGTLTTDAIQSVGIALPWDERTKVAAAAAAAEAAAVVEAGTSDGLDDPDLLLAMDAGDGTAAVTPTAAAATATSTTLAGDASGIYPLAPFEKASREAVLVLAGCHSLVHVDDDVVGDPLELEALSAVQWRYSRGGTVVPIRGGLHTSHGSLRIVARHRFNSALQRMSVVAQVEKAPGVPDAPHVLVKGSPEAIRRLLAGGSPPTGYDETASSLARRGLRVLALAVRRLKPGMSVGAMQHMKRGDVEASLTFVGFVCFECPLRPDSRKTIRALKKSSHACTMITGDATLTAAHVARQVAISTRRMLILELTPTGVAAAAAAAAKAATAASAGTAATVGVDGADGDVCVPVSAGGGLTSEAGEELVAWMSAATGLRRKAFATDAVAGLAASYDLTMSGPALAAVAAADDGVWGVLRHVKVFARMTPALKERVLSSLNAAGLVTLMCGDGTNDVGALKQAHVGVALLSTTVSRPRATTGSSSDGGAAANGAATGANARPSTPAEAMRQRQAAMVRQRQMAQLAVAQRAHTAQVAQRQAAAARDRQGSAEPTDGSTNGGGKEVANQNGAAASGAAGSNASPKTELELRIAELQAALAEGEADGPPLVKLGDASIASPFTSKRMSIDSVASIVRQGRCTLATTLQMYQILALNSLISAYSLSVLHLDGVKVGDRQLTITGILAAAAFFMVSRSKPLRRLSRERPAESIFAPALFLSLLGQFAMHVAALYATSTAAKRYLPTNFRPDVKGSFSPNILNTVVFLLSTAQQTTTFVANYKGRPYMEGLFDNVYLFRTLVACAAIVIFTVAEVSPQVNRFMQLVAFPNSQLRWFVIRVLVADSFGSLVWDRLVSRLFTRLPPVVE
ncbi:hypothetical protein MMPV_002863 [Pyropia vietnamensis]